MKPEFVGNPNGITMQNEVQQKSYIITIGPEAALINRGAFTNHPEDLADMKFYSDGPVRVAVIPGLAKEMLDAGSDWYLNDAESWFNPKSLNG